MKTFPAERVLRTVKVARTRLLLNSVIYEFAPNILEPGGRGRRKDGFAAGKEHTGRCRS